MPIINYYCCGFLFSTDLRQVVLIRKQRPDWQKGKLNGVGGKIEAGDRSFDSYAAMAREFNEETGAIILEEKWKQFATLYFDNSVIHFFLSIDDKNTVLQNITDERVDWFTVDQVLTGGFCTINNIPQLLILARHFINFQSF